MYLPIQLHSCKSVNKLTYLLTYLTLDISRPTRRLLPAISTHVLLRDWCSKHIPIQVLRTAVRVVRHTCQTTTKARKSVSCWNKHSMPGSSSRLDAQSPLVEITRSFGTTSTTKLKSPASKYCILWSTFDLILCRIWKKFHSFHSISIPSFYFRQRGPYTEARRYKQ